jgi:hypothetical protein
MCGGGPRHLPSVRIGWRPGLRQRWPAQMMTGWIEVAVFVRKRRKNWDRWLLRSSPVAGALASDHFPALQIEACPHHSSQLDVYWVVWTYLTIPPFPVLASGRCFPSEIGLSLERDGSFVASFRLNSLLRCPSVTPDISSHGQGADTSRTALPSCCTLA